jgi:two-component system sensor histidine kinase YesM
MGLSIYKMKKIFTNGLRSIHFVLTLWISIFVLVAMIIVAVLLYSKFTNTLTRTVKTNSMQMVEQVAGTLNSYIEEMITISDEIIRDLNAYLIIGSEPVEDTLNATYKTRKDLVSIAFFRSNGSPVAIAPKGLTIKPNSNIVNQSWYLSAARAGDKYVFSSPHVQNIFKGRYSWVVTISRTVSLKNSSIPEKSVFAIDMNFKSMEESCSKITIGSRGYVFILDENNNIIYHPQQQMIYSNIKSEDLEFISGKADGEYTYTDGNSIIVIRSLKHTNWKLIGISYLEDAKATRDEVIRFLGFLLIIAMFFLIIIAVIMSRQITKPIVRLTEAMSEVEKGNLQVHTDENSFYEVSYLGQSFNHMIDRINELLEQIKAEEQELRKSELKALQAQINPHFLYNTLDSILWMCERNEGEGAVIMVQALANLFRFSISKGNELINIRDEIKHAESYLIIQKIRFKDQFEYFIEADESTLPCKTLKIILQPMIENAIYHGINKMVDKGRIDIKIKDRGDSILMQVIDNGLGMTEDVLEGILEQESTFSYGIGVKNVHNRIQIYFGKEYGLSFVSEPDMGTTVNISIPRIEGKEGENHEDVHV